MNTALFKTILTEDEADTVYDPLRIAFMLTMGMFLVLSAYSTIVLSEPFDAMSFGTGAGGLIGATGAGLWASSKQEAA